MLTHLQIQILNFAKAQDSHGTLADFINFYNIDRTAALNSLRDLRKRHLVVTASDLMNSTIEVTSQGYEVMDWR